MTADKVERHPPAPDRHTRADRTVGTQVVEPADRPTIFRCPAGGPAAHDADHAVADPGTPSPTGRLGAKVRAAHLRAESGARVRIATADTPANRKVAVRPCSTRTHRPRRSYRRPAFF